MKILLLTNSFPPMLNSAARLFGELAEELALQGHDIRVLTEMPRRYLARDTGTSKHCLDDVSNAGIHVRRFSLLELPRHLPGMRAIGQMLSLPRYFVRGVLLGSVDAVIAYSPPLPLAVAAILLAWLRNARSVINIQDPYPSAAVDLGLLRGRTAIRLGIWMERWVYRNADRITVHSEGMREHVVLRGGNPQDTHVVENWIDIDRFSPGDEGRLSFRARWDLTDQLLVSYAGIMGFAQQVEDILLAAEMLEDDLPEVRFVLAGEGVARQEMERLANTKQLSNVRFLPHLPEVEYIELLRASDICLITLSSRLRAPIIPGKLACIMGVGKPVVCSVPKTSDARHLVQKVDCGRWVEAGDPAALARAIVELSECPELRREMGQRGREYATRELSKLHGVSRYDELITDPSSE